MNTTTAPCDGLLFDMDGTLWDAVDSYTQVWDRTIAESGGKRPPVRREELLSMMGWHLEDITAKLVPEYMDDKEFLQRLDLNAHLMMPVLGGRLYPGVKDTLSALAERVPLSLVSNCGTYGLENFMDVTGLRPYFRDRLSHGQTLLPKSENIRILTERYNLKNPYYVGDTATDARAAADAGAGMVWCAYGFGTAENPDFTIRSFPELLSLPIIPGAK